LVGLGVSEKQKGRARQVFERSAEQAGVFEHGKNKLVMPGVASGSHHRKGDEIKPPGAAAVVMVMVVQMIRLSRL